jgi:hypothetical protein
VLGEWWEAQRAGVVALDRALAQPRPAGMHGKLVPDQVEQPLPQRLGVAAHQPVLGRVAALSE